MDVSDDPFAAFLVSIGIAVPGLDSNAAAVKREDSDPFGFLTPCLQTFGLYPGGDGGATPAPIAPVVPASNGNAPDLAGPVTTSAGKTLTDTSNSVVPSDKREENGGVGTGGATLSSGGSTNGATSSTHKREDDDSFVVPLGSAASTGAPLKREDDDSLVAPRETTDDTANKRANTLTIKRQDNQSALTTCLALAGPNQDRKRYLSFSAANKRDDCDEQAIEEACLDGAGPDIDCVYLIGCAGNFQQDCSQNQDESKRAVSS